MYLKTKCSGKNKLTKDYFNHELHDELHRTSHIAKMVNCDVQ
jgi:hypothetical protein